MFPVPWFIQRGGDLLDQRSDRPNEITFISPLLGQFLLAMILANIFYITAAAALLSAVPAWLKFKRPAGKSEEEAEEIEKATAACLLHDVAHFDPQVSNPEHGRAGAEIARPLLNSLGYTSDEVDNICYSIVAHVNAKKAHELLHTLEARCVSDADNID